MGIDVWVLCKITELAPDSYELEWRRSAGVWKTTRATAAQLAQAQTRQAELRLPVVPISPRPDSLEAS